MNNNIVVIPIGTEELDQRIQRAVRKAMKDVSIQPVEEPSDELDSNGAALFLGRSMSWLTKMTMENKIPHSKFGNRLVFSRKRLKGWMEANTTIVENPEDKMAQRLADDARRKTK